MKKIKERDKETMLHCTKLRRRAARTRLCKNLLQFNSKVNGMIILIHSTISLERERRSVIERQGMCWEHAYRTFSDSQWKENFRLRRHTFMFLVEELRDDLERLDKPRAVSEKRVGDSKCLPVHQSAIRHW